MHCLRKLAFRYFLSWFIEGERMYLLPGIDPSQIGSSEELLAKYDDAVMSQIEPRVKNSRNLEIFSMDVSCWF